MEGHIRAISILDRILASVLVIMGLTSILILPGRLGAAPFFLIVFGVALFEVGQFLWHFSNGARIIRGLLVIWKLGEVWLGLTFSGGQANLIEIGWNVAILFVLFNATSSKICSPEYRDLIAQNPGTKSKPFSSPFFRIPMWLLILAMLFFLVFFVFLS